MTGAGGTEAGGTSAGAATAARDKVRAVSWWITWDDLKWPDKDIEDRVRRRADEAARSEVNLAIIFGAHFRWDFLPLWSRLHDLIAFIRQELSERRIRLFDHHSSVLVHRPRTRDGAMRIAMRNRHHVPFYPSLEAAAEWRHNGQLLNSWRMIDVATGKPLYIPRYEAEQFCMNNPDFRSAYQSYVRRLIRETGIDGLMSDDGFFYGYWSACGCTHCRERFRREYGHELPPVSDDSFWGNRDSEAFQDWIEMRFHTSRDWLAGVKEVMGDLPLMTCSSGSDAQIVCQSGMTCQDFVRHVDVVMLEMVGSTPDPQGAWDKRIASQALHLGIARDAGLPCLGLGFGLFPDVAFFVWACNRFLGSDPWFSTLKGRFGPESRLTEIADDTELVREAYTWESRHPHLFEGEHVTQVAVLYSRPTRDFYARSDADYVKDYHETCRALMTAGIDFEVVTEIPAPGRWSVLVLSSVTCLGERDALKLSQLLEAGCTIVASGPLGHRDERGRRRRESWLERYGIPVEIEEPPRKPGFPPFAGDAAPAVCRGRHQGSRVPEDAWVEVRSGAGTLYWTPSRLQEGKVALASRVGDALDSVTRLVETAPEGWYFRTYRAGNRLLLHGMPARVVPEMHPSLQNQFTREPVIAKIGYRDPEPAVLGLRLPAPVQRATLFSPDLDRPRPFSIEANGLWRVDLQGVRRYFVAEAVEGQGRPGKSLDHRKTSGHERTTWVYPMNLLDERTRT